MGNRKFREERERARLEREQEELAAEIIQRRKRMIAIGGGLVVAGLVMFAVVQWMLQPLPTDLNGHLTGVREMSFVEGSQEYGGISPVCGCLEPELNSWRGVEFAGRRASLRLGDAIWSQWLISSAEPSSISLAGDETVVRAKAYRLPAEGFDPLAFARAPNRHSGHLGSSTEISSPKFSMLTRGELKIALPGAIPIGAWIPFPKSHVRLTTTRSSFPEAPDRPRLIEHYPPQVGYWPNRNDTPQPKEPQVYPLGDFLGPNLVLWSDDREARVVGTRFGKAAGPGTVTAVVISRANFSTRIGVTPVPDDFAVGSEGFSLDDPDGLAEYGFDSSGTGGTVGLTVDQPLTRKDYERVQGLVTEEPKKWILSDLNPEYGGNSGREYDVLQEHRFPPLPDHVGFNVFGPLESVTFHDITGDLTIDDEHVDLSGGADLDLNKVEVFRNSNDEELISSPLSTGEETAELDFGARGTVSVNGVAQKTVESEYADPIRALAAIMALLGSAAGIYNALMRPNELHPTSYLGWLTDASCTSRPRCPGCCRRGCLRAWRAAARRFRRALGTDRDPYRPCPDRDGPGRTRPHHGPQQGDGRTRRQAGAAPSPRDPDLAGRLRHAHLHRSPGLGRPQRRRRGKGSPPRAHAAARPPASSPVSGWLSSPPTSTKRPIAAARRWSSTSRRC